MRSLLRGTCSLSESDFLAHLPSNKKKNSPVHKHDTLADCVIPCGRMCDWTMENSLNGSGCGLQILSTIVRAQERKRAMFPVLLRVHVHLFPRSNYVRLCASLCACFLSLSRSKSLLCATVYVYIRVRLPSMRRCLRVSYRIRMPSIRRLVVVARHSNGFIFS